MVQHFSLAFEIFGTRTSSNVQNNLKYRKSRLVIDQNVISLKVTTESQIYMLQHIQRQINNPVVLPPCVIPSK